MKRYNIFIPLTLAILLYSQNARAQSTPSCVLNPDGSITCTMGGGSGNNGGSGDSGNENGNNSNACTTGQHIGYEVVSYDESTGICQAFQA